jgi:hypothetical protein
MTTKHQHGDPVLEFRLLFAERARPNVHGLLMRFVRSRRGLIPKIAVDIVVGGIPVELGRIME